MTRLVLAAAAALVLTCLSLSAQAQVEDKTTPETDGQPSVTQAQRERPDWWRERRRGTREEYAHKKSGQIFLSPRGWGWRDPDNHFKVNKLCYPADAKNYMPNVILRIKPLDEGVTFPMIVEYAEYRLRRLMSVKEVIEDAPIEMDFENQGAHVLHVRGSLQGIDVECRQIVYLRGQWFTVIACGSRQGDFEQYLVDWQELIDDIQFADPEE